jgi:hypothetical protein
MDIMKEITAQINSIKKIDTASYLDSVLTHLDRAEFYYSKDSGDSNYFNDVIYRSNQAYEGALKESYKVLAGKSEEDVFKTTPNNIEKYFETNHIFRERVLQLFRNYRQEWRNKSTHDHKLFFDESEAFLALTSVNSFVHLLLKEIQEKIAFNLQEKKLKESASQTEGAQIPNVSSTDPLKKIESLIASFAKSNAPYIYASKDLKEIEVIGLFHAYVKSVDGISIVREPSIEVGGVVVRADFIIKVGSIPVVLEFKRQKRAYSGPSNLAINQAMTYMQGGEINHGIIYFANFHEANPQVKVDRNEIIVADKHYYVSVIKS